LINDTKNKRGLVTNKLSGGPLNIFPTADPNLRGGERIDLNLGINIYQSKGKYKGHRFAIEAGAPIYQSLDGPQLETDFLFSAGWSYTW